MLQYRKSSIVYLFSFLPVSLYTVCPLITDAQTGQKKTIYKYILQLPEYSSICNTGITSIFQNLPVYLQYWYNQYFPESSGICKTHILAMTSIF